MSGARDLLQACPQPPHFSLDWELLLREHAFLRAMIGVEQDPEHHAEGDVATHTRMVCEALLAMPAYAALPATERAVLFAAAVLHDVAKPRCTVVEQGRIRAPFHAPRGAVMARAILWRMGAPFALREQVVALVQHHQVPFYAIDRPDPRRAAILAAETARCRLLTILAEADARGRICKEPQRLLDQVTMFGELCVEHGVLDAPHPFASDHSRFLYYRTPGRDPAYLAHDDTRGEVVLMSGLPGVGKSHYIETRLAGWPRVSLDQLREDLEVDPRDGQGLVAAQAREAARVHLRVGRPFVFDATSLTRKVRARLLDLVTSYRGRTKIVYVEVPADVQARQNRARPRRVPAAAIERMLSLWQVPDRTEAHAVEYVVTDAARGRA
ncbi:MAG: AAA family ATPase [Kofleriaceae bacterium]